MATTEQPKQKGRFWKIALKILTLGYITAKAGADAGQVNGAGGAILRKMPPELSDNAKNTEDDNDSK